MKPDYILKVKAVESKYAARIGAAWKTKTGDGISIKIDPGLAIHGGQGISVTLWPNDSESFNSNSNQRGQQQQQQPPSGNQMFSGPSGNQGDSRAPWQ